MRVLRRWPATILAGLVVAGCAVRLLPDLPATVPATGGDAPPAGLPNGVAAGDVTQNSVVLWARPGGSRAATGVVTFTLQSEGTLQSDRADAREPLGRDAPLGAPITRTVSNPLLPVTVTVTGLAPATRYRYQAEVASGDRASGVFRTPAAEGDRRGLRFAATGDVRGDLAPYPAISNAPGRDLDFFVNLGDTVYADFISPTVPKPAASVEEFLLKHVEVNSTYLGLNALAALRVATVSFATLDDHEVRNNFAGGAPAAANLLFGPSLGEQGGLFNETRLYAAGVGAFLAYQPVVMETYGPDADARMVGRPKIYRYRTFGADAALFILDLRSFRDAPLARVTDLDSAETLAAFEAASFDARRTVLGRTQMADLQRDLLDAQTRGITWKFVVTPDPIQYLDMTAAVDRWQGYAAERTELLRFIAEAGIDNVVFITADIHGMVVNDLTYQEAAGGPQIPVAAWEIAVGPVAAYPPFGLAMFLTYLELGLVTEADQAAYEALPIRHDGDDAPDDRDDYVKSLINEQMARFGFDPLGLNPASAGAAADAAATETAIQAELLAGDYLAGHVYGWTEFEVDAGSQALTVTTYGIPAYLAADMARAGEAMVRLAPAVVSRFVVQPRED
jgi:phosphodiesterase/alkaline phosphatase D-like protein